MKKPKTLQHQNMADSLKRKIETRTTHEKYKILKEIDRGSFCASVTKNNNIHNQTLSEGKDQTAFFKFFNEEKTMSAPDTILCPIRCPIV